MNHRSPLRRKLFVYAAAIAMLGLVIGGTACSPPPQASGQIGGMPAAAGEMKTLAVVVVNSYERLMGDVSFLGGLAGMPGADQIVQAGILGEIGDKGLAAIDKTKPWGIILQTDGQNFTPLGAIPVASADNFIAALQAQGMQFNDRGNGLREFSLPNGMPLVTKAQGGWLLIGQSAEAFAHVPANLQGDLTNLVTNYDIAIRLHMNELPDAYKQLAMTAMQSGLQQSMKKLPEESAQQFQLRQQAAEAQITQMSQLLQQADKLTFGMAIDAKQQRAYFDGIVEALPGTDLAKQLAVANDPRTDFGGFYQADAAATFTYSDQFDPATVPELVAKTRLNINSAKQQLSAALEADENVPAGMKNAIKLAADDFAESLVATAEAGKVDSGAFLRIGSDTMTLVSGARVKQPAKIVEGLKKLDAAGKASTPGFSGITWDAAQQGDVKFHTLSVPLPNEADPSFRKMVGDQLAVAIGIGPEAVYLAVGRDNMEAVKRAIDASKADANKKVPPFEIALSLGPIMELVAMNTNDDNMRPVLLNLASMLKNDARGRDHVRVLAQFVPNGSRYRFEAEEGALRALVQAAIFSQMSR